MTKYEMAEACSTHGSEEMGIQVFGGETWGNETTWKLRRRWKDGFKMDIEKVEWIMDWFALAQNTDSWRALVNGLMKWLVP